MKLEPKRIFRYAYLRFIRLKEDSGVLSRGVAVGAFIGITPTIPFHTILILLFAFLVRGSKVAGILASWVVSNPLTFSLQYYLSWKIGVLVTPYNFSWKKIQSIMDMLSKGSFMESINLISLQGSEIIICMLVGGCLLALPLATVLYFVSKSFCIKVEKKRLSKHVMS